MVDETSERTPTRVTKPGTQERRTAPKCRSCVTCRARKSRCDGVQPRCGYCTRVGRECAYPQDARSVNKPTRAQISLLESNIEALQRLVAQRNDGSQAGQSQSPVAYSTPDVSFHANANGHSGTSRSQDSYRLSANREAPEKRNDGPSPSEILLAGTVAQDGGVQAHGVASMFHRRVETNSGPTRSFHVSVLEKEQRNQTSQARLVAYASMQRQRESLILRNPSVNQNVDFDGVDPELALHLIDTHFNRQHYTFLISYRPAITDSLVNNGPYCNKVLLNAIYLSSSVYSDRVHLRSNPKDPQSAGERFYNRLRALLADCIEHPSIPTATGLLLSGAILVSSGRVSAGWMHSGMAYRMITDLGCHLAVESRRPGMSSELALLTDVELEIRKRLYWGAVGTDITQSLYFGRSPSMKPSQARVPQQLLDTYEELEVWSPYVDPSSPRSYSSYVPRPAYAVSTFDAMNRLMEISRRTIKAFYSMQSLHSSGESVRKSKTEIESELEIWYTSLPSHLQFDPDNDATFPPHQMTLLTTYHMLRILIIRPCISHGHLSNHFDESTHTASEYGSVDAALKIWRLVESYKATFSLSRAPYLVSYSVYSAIVAILNQRVYPRSHFKDCMVFYWSALLDLRRGANFGLQKPMEILKEMMNQFGEEMPQSAETEDLDNIEGMLAGTESTNIVVTQPPSIDGVSWSGSANAELELPDWPDNDVLYGLFTANSGVVQ